jgi:hypothetical protein
VWAVGQTFVFVDRGDWWSWDHTCGVPGLDVMVQPTNAGREPLYTEEDDGASLLEARTGLLRSLWR